jgi:hypothetical protein
MVSRTISTEVPAHLQSLLDAAVASAHELAAIAQDFSPLNEWFAKWQTEEWFDAEILGTVFSIGEGSFFAKIDDDEITGYDFGTPIGDGDEWIITDEDRIGCSRKRMAFSLDAGEGFAACTTGLISSTGQRALVGWMMGPEWHREPEPICLVHGFYATKEAFKVALNARNQWFPEQITDQMILDSWPPKKERKPKRRSRKAKPPGGELI